MIRFLEDLFIKWGKKAGRALQFLSIAYLAYKAVSMGWTGRIGLAIFFVCLTIAEITDYYTDWSSKAGEKLGEITHRKLNHGKHGTRD